MTYSLSKIWTAMITIGVMVSSLVHGFNDEGTYYQGNDFSPNQDLGYNSYQNHDNSQFDCGASRSCFANYWVDGEVLYLKACEDGLPVATSLTPELTIGGARGTKQRIDNFHFDWDVGFRIGVGANITCCDCWDASVYWTHFFGRGHRDVNNLEVAELEPAFGAIFEQALPGSIDLASKIESHWHLDLDLIDFDLGRTFCVTSCLALRPHVGVRYGRIDQKFHIDSTEAFIGTPIVSTANGNGNFGARQALGIAGSREVHLKNRFEGAGLRLGLDSIWTLGCGFSIYGNTAASLLYGRFHVNAHEVALFPSGPSIAPASAANFGQAQSTSGAIPFVFEQHDRFSGTQGITECALGLRWQHCFCNNTLVTFQVGWEHHFFFDQNRFDDVVFAADAPINDGVGPGGISAESGLRGIQFNRGDLSVQGVTFALLFDF
jgi:hypothetical protein